MKILLSVFFTIQISAGLANIDSVTRVDTIDNWQIYLDLQHLLSGNSTYLYYERVSPLFSVEVSEQHTSLFIFFGGCPTGMDYYVEAVDEKDKNIGQFELSDEERIDGFPMAIPADLLRENIGRRIKFYQLDPKSKERKYLLIDLEILGD